MSPLVQRARPGSGRKSFLANQSDVPAGDQHWGMLLLESLSGGALALAVGIIAVLLVVGAYALLVWPITFWDLGDGQQYDSWAKTVLWSVFAGGSLAGYWCFSGSAFKGRSRRGTSASRRRPESRR